MLIIHRGEVPDITKRFECKYCGTLFEAAEGEYVSCNQMEYMHDGLEYKCLCPVCGRTVYIEKGEKR